MARQDKIFIEFKRSMAQLEETAPTGLRDGPISASLGGKGARRLGRG
jgi:hypothetical protein